MVGADGATLKCDWLALNGDSRLLIPPPPCSPPGRPSPGRPPPGLPPLGPSPPPPIPPGPPCAPPVEESPPRRIARCVLVLTAPLLLGAAEGAACVATIGAGEGGATVFITQADAAAGVCAKETVLVHLSAALGVEEALDLGGGGGGRGGDKEDGRQVLEPVVKRLLDLGESVLETLRAPYKRSSLIMALTPHPSHHPPPTHPPYPPSPPTLTPHSLYIHVYMYVYILYIHTYTYISPSHFIPKLQRQHHPIYTAIKRGGGGGANASAEDGGGNEGDTKGAKPRILWGSYFTLVSRRIVPAHAANSLPNLLECEDPPLELSFDGALSRARVLFEKVWHSFLLFHSPIAPQLTPNSPQIHPKFTPNHPPVTHQLNPN